MGVWLPFIIAIFHRFFKGEKRNRLRRSLRGSNPPPAPTPSEAASPQTILTAQPHPPQFAQTLLTGRGPRDKMKLYYPY